MVLTGTSNMLGLSLDHSIPEVSPMAKAKKTTTVEPKRVRPRPNSVMVDLGPEIRPMLDAIREDLSRTIRTEPVTITSTVRRLVIEEFKRRNLKLKNR